MNEIARVDEGNNEYIVYWDSEDGCPRIQMDCIFVAMDANKSVSQTLFNVFGETKRIGDLVVGRRYSGLPFEYTMVRDFTWKELKHMYVTFRVYPLKLRY